jgi:ATP/maltotriose-dependent transcriptional regulator MalT
MSKADSSGSPANSSNGPAQRDVLTRLVPPDQPTEQADEDLRHRAMALYLAGRDDECVALLGRAFHEQLSGHDRAAAVRCAFWIAFILTNAGQHAIASGWLTRARRLLETEPGDTVEHGYLLLPDAFQHVARGQYAQADELAGRAAALADRFDDPDLAPLARHVQGRASIRRGDVAGGVALLDEAMLGVLTEAVSPVVLTIVYCGLIEGCQELLDLDRSREWTAALAAWYEARPTARLNRGRCLVHRAEVQLESGDWSAALSDAVRARDLLADPAAQPMLGAAHYVIGELHRLRGSADAAEEEYRQAGENGHDPQPGLALLRLAEGSVASARAAIHRAWSETPEQGRRPKLLAAYVEIMLRADDVPAARVAADELRDIAEHFDTPYVAAMSAWASGAVLLADGETHQALGLLRRGCAIWQSLQVPYELARCRVLHGQGCRELGDDEGARMQLSTARSQFRRLGAAVDATMTPTIAKAPTSGALTVREVEVLRLVAKGMPNRLVAEQLGLRDKTIARHLSNIFAKLDLRSRSAATAYAYEHRLI